MDKDETRRAALARRDGLDMAVRAQFATRLAAVGPRLVLEFAPGNAALVVSLYAAIRTEPSLMPLADALHGAGVELALPVTGRPGDPLLFHRWAPGDPMAAGPLGIAEPLRSAPTVDPDMLFVPLAAFDRRGQRIGYGAGHYDRTLAGLRARKAVRAIGVGFAVQEELFIPDEAHDEPLDLVVTDRDIVLCDL